MVGDIIAFFKRIYLKSLRFRETLGLSFHLKMGLSGILKAFV